METEYLPSKKFVKVVTLIIVIGVVCIVLYKGFPFVKNAITDFFETQNNKLAQQNEDAYRDYRRLDTDGDGLLDWEESLYGTDPEKVDTDGDGVGDYADLRGTAELNNDNSDGVSASVTGDPDNFDPTNLTDSLARDLYTSLSVAKQQSGGSVTEEHSAELAAIASSNIQKFQSRQYSDKDIATVAPGTATRSAELSSRITAAWTLEASLSEDLRRMLSAIDNDASIPVDITSRLQKYSDVTKRLLAIAVPESIKLQYLGYINSVEYYMAVITAIGNNDNDPARAIGAMVNLESAIDNFEKADKQLTTAISSLR